MSLYFEKSGNEGEGYIETIRPIKSLNRSSFYRMWISVFMSFICGYVILELVTYVFVEELFTAIYSMGQFSIFLSVLLLYRLSLHGYLERLSYMR